MRVQEHYVPHLKDLISVKVDLEAQGCDSTFTLCHTLVKKDILHLQMPSVQFVFCTTVSEKSSNFTEEGVEALFGGLVLCPGSSKELNIRALK